MLPLDQLKLSKSQISLAKDDLKTYGKDWAMYYKPAPSAVLFPTSEDDILDIINWAREHKIALVPSGGRTGLSSAATATNGEIIVSFDRMNKILDFNEHEAIVTVQPGVITEELHNFAKEKGLYFPIDFAAKGSSQIGGNVATNAGGVKVVRYGLTRNWITGLKVVTGGGEKLHLNKSLRKNATGYDLRHLFIGSEGTLGLFTEIEVQLTQTPPPLKVLVLGMEKLEHSLNLFKAFNKSFTLSACEFFSQDALDIVLSQHELSPPFETKSPFYLLLELEEFPGNFDDQLESVFSDCFENGWIMDGVISQNSQQAQNFWSLREFISESISPQSPYKNDVSVRVSKVPEFVERTQELISKNYPDFQVIWFGHIGDGNVHINILKPETMDKEEFIKLCKESDPLLYQLISDFNGSISAEHGVGLIKKDYLHYSKSSAEINYMKQIKKSFDPDQILNPGKIF